MDRIQIITLLKETRLNNGQSLQAIADIVKSNKADIYTIETKHQNISIDKLIKLCEALQLDITIQPKQ